MAFVSKAEPVEPPADNGALDLSVSSPRRAPSASDRLSSDTSPSRSLNSPPGGSSIPRTSSLSSLPTEGSKTAPSLDPQQTSTPQQQRSTGPTPQRAASSTSLSSPLVPNQPQPPCPTVMQGIHGTHKSPSKASSAPSTSGGLDLEKLRSVHHIMQNRPNAASVMPQQQVRHSLERLKMPVPPQNRPMAPTASVHNQALRQGLIQTLKCPPPPGADEVTGVTMQPAPPRSHNTDPPIIPANSLIRIQPSGLLNWNGQPLQFVTNVRIPGSKVSGSVQLAAAPQLLKLAPDMPVTIGDRGIIHHNKIQPKPPPNGNGSNSSISVASSSSGSSSVMRPTPTQIGVIDSATVSLAMQRFQKSMRPQSDQEVSSTNKLPISGKIPSPPSQMRFPQTHRPIMPKPCRPSQQQTQAPQPVIYLCTLPAASVTAQPQQLQQPVAPVEPSSSGQQQSNSTNNGAQTSQKAVQIPIMERVLKDEHVTPPPQETKSFELPIAIQIVNPTATSETVKTEKLDEKEKETVPEKKDPPEPSEPSSSKSDPPAANVKMKRTSSVEEPSQKKAKDVRPPSPLPSSKPEQKTSEKKLSGKAKIVAPKKKVAVKRPKIITHVIDGFVILESDQPILAGALEPDEVVIEERFIEESDGSEQPLIAVKRRRRISSTPSKTSSTATPQRPVSSASNAAAAPSPAGSAKCFKCKRKIPSGRGVKNYNFKGNQLCGFNCYSQVRHEYATSSQRQKRKFKTENATTSSPPKKAQPSPRLPTPPPQELGNKKQVSPQQRSVSPIKVATMPPFLMSPLPTAPYHPPPQQAVISPAPSVVSSSSSNKPPNQWTVADVNDFIKGIPGCEEAAQKFLEQEIDGPALLLLKSEVMVQLMGLKIGPVLKITSRLVSLGGGSASGGRDSAVGGSPPSASRLSHPQAPSGTSSFVKQS